MRKNFFLVIDLSFPMRGYWEIREYRARVSDKDWRIVSHVRDTILYRRKFRK